MPCVPAPVIRPIIRATGDMFAFAPARDGLGRAVANTTTLMTAPWMAFWAVTLEAMNPENYHLP